MSDDDNDTGNGGGRRNGEEDLGGVQAVETAVRVLSALIDMGQPLMLKTVAERAEMQPPKAHRYLVSFCRSGLAERDPFSGGYRLGPLAVRVGLAALRHLNVTKVVTPILAALRDELGFTTSLAIWGTAGPTLVQLEETNDALIIGGRLGSVMPILSSSSGRVFGAFLPRALVAPFLERELEGMPHPGANPVAPHLHMSRAEAAALFEQVYRRKLANVKGEVSPAIHGVSAPVFDHAGALAGVITVMGSAGLVDTRLDGPVATRLAGAAEEASRRMGWTPDAIRPT